MPIPDNILPDHKKRTAETLQKSSEKIQDQLQALNAVMRARRLNKCQSNDCIGCGNIDCIEAEKEYLKLWPETENESLPVSSASTTNITSSATSSKSDAQSRNSHEQKPSERPGIPANGLNLFNFDQQEKAT